MFLRFLVYNRFGRYFREKKKKKQLKYEMRAKDADVLFTFASATPEEKATMTVIITLKVLTDQITITITMKND